jgi:hypothetical protein
VYSSLHCELGLRIQDPGPGAFSPLNPGSGSGVIFFSFWVRLSYIFFIIFFKIHIQIVWLIFTRHVVNRLYSCAGNGAGVLQMEHVLILH